MTKKILFLLLMILPLSACVSHEDTDARLAKGCEAATNLLLKDGFKIKEVKDSTFKTSSEFGSGFREVTLTAVESDSWIDYDREYKCIFAEEIGPLGLTYSADFYQITVNGETFGESGTELLGDADTLTKITAAAQAGIIDGK